MIEGAVTNVIALGDIAFTVHDAGSGPLVLCLHGFPDTPTTFRKIAPALVQAGYRVAAPVMRGYEPSSQPVDGDYSMAALSEDVAALARALDPAPAHLLGHDWGASIAYAAATRAPAQWRSLTALAVPHTAAFAGVMAGDHEQLRRSWYIFLIQIRGTAEALLSADRFAMLERLWRDWSPDWLPDPVAMAAVIKAFEAPGVLGAALSYYRTAFDTAGARAAVSAAIWADPVRVPTLGLVGERDGCIAPEVFERAMPQALFPAGLEVARVPGAGHFLHLEQPELVHARVLRFLASLARQESP